jgi:hypothetical protein
MGSHFRVLAARCQGYAEGIFHIGGAVFQCAGGDGDVVNGEHGGRYDGLAAASHSTSNFCTPRNVSVGMYSQS